jgi:nucleoside-triphosphatase
VMFALCSPGILLAKFFSIKDPESTLILITGPRGVGKTSWCQEMIRDARQRSLSIGGLVSPAVFVAGEKTGIDLLDISTGQRRRLAEHRPAASAGQDEGPGVIATEAWVFRRETLEWGNATLACLGNVDILLLDELGPLEFQRGKGLQAGLARLDTHQDRLAMAVVRPELLSLAIERWPWAQVYSLSHPLPQGFGETA